MLRCMYSGISGLKINQTKLDVIGNNIANVGTTAFKNQRIRFQDMLSQNVKQATGPNATLGGTNPSQVGLGAEVAGIDTKVSQGNMQTTGNNLDFMVDGDGYFVVGRGATGDNKSNTIADNVIDSDEDNPFDISFTRDGSFSLDEFGQLVNSDGLRVMGYLMDGETLSYDDSSKPVITGAPDVNAKAAKDRKTATKVEAVGEKIVPLAIPKEINGETVTNFSVEKNGVIKATLTSGSVVAVGQMAMADFKNPAGLMKEGKNLNTVTANSGPAVFRTGLGADEDASNEKGYGNVIQGALEMSNVDLAEQFTEMIVASRAFQANGKIITTGDEILQDLVNLKR